VDAAKEQRQYFELQTSGKMIWGDEIGLVGVIDRMEPLPPIQAVLVRARSVFAARSASAYFLTL